MIKRLILPRSTCSKTETIFWVWRAKSNCGYCSKAYAAKSSRAAIASSSVRLRIAPFVLLRNI